MENFAQRMAARIASEQRASTGEAAATGAADTNPEELQDQESSLTEQDDREQHQQSELEAAGAGEPQNSPPGAFGILDGV